MPEYFQIFFIFHDNKQNIFGFFVSWKKRDIWR